MVLLTGEAGIGKSRITEALVEAVAGEPHFLLRYQCSPYHADSALYPVIQQLTFAAGFAADDSTERRLDRLEALLARGSDDIGEAAPLIAALLGLDGSSRYGALTLDAAAAPQPHARRPGRPARRAGAAASRCCGWSRTRTGSIRRRWS